MNQPHFAPLPGVNDLGPQPKRQPRYHPTYQRLQQDADQLQQLLAQATQNAPRDNSHGAHQVPGEVEVYPPGPPSPGTHCPTCLGTGIGVDTLPCPNHRTP